MRPNLTWNSLRSLICVRATVAFVVAMGCSSVAHAQGGKVFWTDSNNSGKATANVWRADLNGTSVKKAVTQKFSNARFIAIDTTLGKMYWADVGEIRRANLDGTEVTTLVSDILGPLGIALDVPARKIYWTDSATNKIQRANLGDGSGLEDVVTDLRRPKGLALDRVRRKVYWTEEAGVVRRANLDGSGVEDLVSGLEFPMGIALDVVAQEMYVAESRRIQKARFDGSGLTTLISGVSGVLGIAVDIPAGRLYFTEIFSGPSGKIRRARLDGSRVQDLVSSGLDTPWGLAIIRIPVDAR
jgi:sugar lactone lactonase YvrE